MPFNIHTLSNANEKYDLLFFRDFKRKIIELAQQLYQDGNLLDLKLKGKVNSFDTSTFNLCLDVFLWQNFNQLMMWKL